MGQRLPDRQALDALGAPIRADLVARHAPDLLGVFAKKRLVEVVAEPVDQEIFQRVFGRAREGACRGIAADHPPDPQRPELHRRREIGLQRVGEKLAVEIDPRQPVAHQHRRLVGPCRGIAGHIDRPALVLVGDLELALLAVGLDRQDVAPPVHHPVGLGEEPVAADVDAVAVVVDGPGDAADFVRGLEHDDLHRTPAQDLQRRGQPRRAGADDNGGFFGHRRTISTCPPSLNSSIFLSPKLKKNTSIADSIFETR